MVKNKKNRAGNYEFLHMRITPRRMAVIRYLAEAEEKSMTCIIEEAIDSYLKPRAVEAKKRARDEGDRI